MAYLLSKVHKGKMRKNTKFGLLKANLERAAKAVKTKYENVVIKKN